MIEGPGFSFQMLLNAFASNENCLGKLYGIYDESSIGVLVQDLNNFELRQNYYTFLFGLFV